MSLSCSEITTCTYRTGSTLAGQCVQLILACNSHCHLTICSFISSTIILANTYRYIGRSFRTAQPREPRKVATLRPPGAICRYKRHFDRHRPGHQQIQWQTIQEKKKSLAPPTRQDKTRQGRANQDRTRQGKARQGRARQCKARQGRAREGKAMRCRTRQGEARQGNVCQSKAGQGTNAC